MGSLLHQLEAINAVIVNGSITTAAADLGISQPATTRLLSDLSKEFDFGITDGFFGHPAVDRQVVDIRTVCVFPTGHRLESLDQVAASDLADEKIIHTRRDSDFFRQISRAFQDAHVEMKSVIEVRQFTAACEFV